MPTKTELEAELEALKEKLARPGAGRPKKPRCKCGKYPDTPRNRKNVKRHPCWTENNNAESEITLDAENQL